MILTVSLRRHDVQRAAVQVRGRHAEHRRRRRARRRDRLSRAHRLRQRSPRTSTSCSIRDRRACDELPGVRMIGTARTRPSVLSFVLEAFMRTISARSSTAKASRSAPDIIARCRSWSVSGAGDGARVVRLLQQPRRRRPADRSACGARWRSSVDELKELYREVILDHNRRPRNFGELARRGPRGRRRQSAVRRQAHVVREDGRRHSRADVASKARVARFRSPRRR